MSEATAEYLEAEADPESDYEAWAMPESEEAPEEAPEAWPESDRSRRERQMRMLRARQQAQLRRQPAPRRPQPAAPQRPTRFAGPSASQVRGIQADVISLDLDTKAALARLRRALEESGRQQYKASWAGAGAAASALLVNQFPGLQDWAKTAIIGAPMLALTPYGPGKRRPKGLEGFFGDPRITIGLALFGLWGYNHFAGQSQGVSRIAIEYKGPLTAAAGGKNNTATLTAVALNSAGSQVPNVTYGYNLSNPSVIGVAPQLNPGVYQLTGQNTGPTYFTVTAGGKNNGVWVDVT
jgi:hypothetical protein